MGNVIYGITHDDDLLRYHHSGHTHGTYSWAIDTGQKVGNGWDFKTVFGS